MSTYYGLYTFGSTPYREYLQTKSFVEDITGSTQQLRMTVSKESRAMIANAEQLNGRQIEVLDSVANEVGNLGSELRAGFETICYGLKEISQSVEYLDATFHWGFTEMLTEFRQVNASLEELVQLVKNPAQTWAYEQFETARDAARQNLYPEAIEALGRAINGFGPHTGYKLEYRFHYYLGKIYLGDAENTDPAVLSLEQAEVAFSTAARYAKADSPKEASLAVTAAGWAAYCQGKLNEAVNHTRQTIDLDKENAEAHFQLGKIYMHLGDVSMGIESLGHAISLDRHYSLKAAAGGEGQGEGERYTNFHFKKTSNTQHRTSNAQPRRAFIRCWMLDVGRWMFPLSSPRRGRILRRVLSQCQPSVPRQFFPANHPPAATGNSTSELSQRARSLSPLPGGEGQGEGERHTNLVLKRSAGRGMNGRGIRTPSEEFCFPIPLPFIPLPSAFVSLPF